MKTLIMMVGLPRSGKTTWVQENAPKLNAAIVSPDALRLALHGQRFEKKAEPHVWAMAETMTRALFLAGHETVIIDATNNTAKRREPWEKLAHEFEANVILQYVRTTAAECIERAVAEGDSMIIPVIQRMNDERDW